MRNGASVVPGALSASGSASRATPGSQRNAAAVSAAPSLSPQISVRPVVDSDARTLHFPDWSAPPSAPEEHVEVTPALAPAAADLAARVAPVVTESAGVGTPSAVSAPGETLPTAPVRANATVRQAGAWSLVLQA